MALVRERTIPTERPPPVGEVSANYLGLCKYTLAQRRNRLTTRFSERIPVVKRRVSVVETSYSV
jgi:hypothetical protein